MRWVNVAAERMASMVASTVTGSYPHRVDQAAGGVLGQTSRDAAQTFLHELFMQLDAASLTTEPAADNNCGRTTCEWIDHYAIGRACGLDEELGQALGHG